MRARKNTQNNDASNTRAMPPINVIFYYGEISQEQQRSSSISGLAIFRLAVRSLPNIHSNCSRQWYGAYEP